MKIAFIEPHLLCVGGIRRIIEISNHLVGFGHEVVLYTPTGKPCLWLPCKADIHKISKIEKWQHDVAIFNLADQYPLMHKIKSKKKFFWVLAPEALYKSPEIPVAALKQGFKLLANSKFTVEYIVKFLGMKVNVPIIPGGINPHHFKYDPTVPKEYDVIYYGSKRPWKGTKIIEDAIAPLRSKVKVLRMEGLNTPQHMMYKLYNRANCCVTANFMEGFSFVQLEAMACGCPVVTTDDGGSRDYIRDGINAIIVKRDAISIREGILKMLSDKKIRTRILENGMKTLVDSKYEWRNCTKHLESIISK
jgi:glycosyltransferase involved in cell wall biosynthesis